MKRDRGKGSFARVTTTTSTTSSNSSSGGLDVLAQQWLTRESSSSSGSTNTSTAVRTSRQQVDRDVETDIEHQVGDLLKELRLGRERNREARERREENIKAERQRRQELLQEGTQEVGRGLPSRSRRDELSEEQKIRKMVARRIVSSQRSALNHRSQQRMLDRDDISTVVCNKVEVMLVNCAEYLEECPEETCSICLEPLKGGVLRISRCKHLFHFLCILKWFEIKQVYKCPYCKQDIDVSP